MSDWKCSGCGTHYPLTVTKCECEKAKPVQTGDGTRVRIKDLSSTKVEPSCPVKGGLCNCTGACRGETVHSASWVLPQFNGQVSCNVAGCDCGTNGTPLHQRVIADENRLKFQKGACGDCLVKMVEEESEGDVFDPTYAQCENEYCKWYKFGWGKL